MGSPISPYEDPENNRGRTRIIGVELVFMEGLRLQGHPPPDRRQKTTQPLVASHPTEDSSYTSLITEG